MQNFTQYQEEVRADVAKTLKDLQCQPIIFVSSGFPRRTRQHLHGENCCPNQPKDAQPTTADSHTASDKQEAAVPKDANTTHIVVKVLEQFNSTGAAMEEGADVGYE